jgi:hypothetical protein
MQNKGFHMKISTKEVVKTINVDLDNGHFENLKFKAIISKSDAGKYSADIFRLDVFNMKPSFGTMKKSDEYLYVLDTFFEFADRNFDTIHDLETSLVVEINERLTTPS